MPHFLLKPECPVINADVIMIGRATATFIDIRMMSHDPADKDMSLCPSEANGFRYPVISTFFQSVGLYQYPIWESCE